MPTKKKEAAEAPLAPNSRVYDQSVEQYAAAMELLRKGDFSAARDQFVEICKLAKDEPELSERAGTYARICNQRLDPSVQEPVGFEENYHRAVMLSNQGQWDAAISLLDRALTQDPTSVSCLYVRASAWALKGSVDKAVADLRQAIAIDPKLRFQAVNDPDFEKIREEPSFIDIIEPTPAGV